MTKITCDRCGCELEFRGNGINAVIPVGTSVVAIVAYKSDTTQADLCNTCLYQLAIAALGTANASAVAESSTPEANKK
jgi:hypothetical protein